MEKQQQGKKLPRAIADSGEDPMGYSHYWHVDAVRSSTFVVS